MFNSDTNLRSVHLRTSPHFHILCSNRANRNKVHTIMTHINEEEEHIIDNLKDKSIKLVRGNRVFRINHSQIYCYGEVDFNNKDELNIIDGFKFLNYLDNAGIPIPSNYNYETHESISPNNGFGWTETWSPAVLARFAHASINKPKRIILFSHN